MTRDRNGFAGLVRRCSTLLADLGTLIAMAIAFLILYDIVMRLAFGRPFVGTTDLVAVSLLVVTFTQAPKALLLGKFLEVSVLTDRLPDRVRNLVAALGNILGAGVFLGLAITSIHSIDQALVLKEFFGSDAFRIPVAPIRIGITFTWIVFVLCFLLMATNALKGKRHD